MQKAKTFNQASTELGSLLVIFLVFFVPILAQAQPAMGQLIEQAKKSKLQELLPTAAPADFPAKKNAAPIEKSVAPEPILWSLSGINDAMTAEVLIENRIHRFAVRPGLLLTGDWTVLAVSSDSLTLRNSKKTIDLSPSARGSTGAEYPSLNKTKTPDVTTFAGIQESLSSRGFPIEIMGGAEPNKAVGGREAAREAASSLPKK